MCTCKILYWMRASERTKRHNTAESRERCVCATAIGKTDVRDEQKFANECACATTDTRTNFAVIVSNRFSLWQLSRFRVSVRVTVCVRVLTYIYATIN